MSRRREDIHRNGLTRRIYLTADREIWKTLNMKHTFTKVCKADIYVESSVRNQITSYFNAQTREEAQTILTKLKRYDLPAIIYEHLEVSSDVQQALDSKRFNDALPVYKYRTEVLKKVLDNDVAIIIGETGSGKSTQLVQYLYAAGLAGDLRIVCTQPRKIATVMLTKRVAQEMGTTVGCLVGYKTGAKNVTSDDTKIVFQTDHCLFNECVQDRDLSKFACIVVDEANERSIYTDLLLGMIKACLRKRSDLKVIITSATIDPKVFIDYFKTETELKIPGKLFPIEVIYDQVDKDDVVENYEQRALAKAISVHLNEERGDILVFLTSPIETIRCCEEFEKQVQENTFKCFPLFGQMPQTEFSKVFDPLPTGLRKIVFATNCAETSITIEGIRYIIDTGVAKENRYDVKKNISVLQVRLISKSSSDQRKGRAGRTLSGKCFRLYTENVYQSMEPMSRPEVLNTNLGQAALKMAVHGIDISSFDFIEPPNHDDIVKVYLSLQEVGVISTAGVTKRGRWVSALNCDPRHGLIIYRGILDKIPYDAIVVAALLSIGGRVFYRGLETSEQQLYSQVKSHYDSLYGDIFTWLSVFKDWTDQPKELRVNWCLEKSLNYRMLKIVNRWIKEVVITLEKEMGISVDERFSNKDDSSLRSCLLANIYRAYPSSLCHYLGHPKAGYLLVNGGKQFHLHPSSSFVSLNSQPEWILSTQFLTTSRDFLTGVVSVDEDLVQLMLLKSKRPHDIDKIKRKKVKLVHKAELGETIFLKFVGVKFSNIRLLEETLTQAGMQFVVVHACKEWGTIEVYALHAIKQSALSLIKAQTDCQHLISDNKEIALVQNEDGSNSCGVRVILGRGGLVEGILYPNESLKVGIKKTSKNTSEADIRDKFEQFGTIIQCQRMMSQEYWGFVKYSCKRYARNAIENTKNDTSCIASLMTNSSKYQKHVQYEVRLNWCRRPIIKNGTAFVNCRSELVESLRDRKITFSFGERRLQISRDRKSLMCFNIGHTDEKEIKTKIRELCQELSIPFQGVKVVINREQVPEHSAEYLRNMTEYLTQEFEKFTHNSEKNFKITLIPPKAYNTEFTAYVKFFDAQEGKTVCDKAQNSELRVRDEKVKIYPSFMMTITCKSAIATFCRPQLDKLQEELSSTEKIQMTIKTIHNYTQVIYLKSDKPGLLQLAKDKTQKILQGQVIDCAESSLIFKMEGRKELKELEREHRVLIDLDPRNSKLHLYGEDVLTAEVCVREFLNKLKCCKREVIFLKGDSKPTGLLKALRNHYGSLPDRIVDKFELFDAQINFVSQRLIIYGYAEAVHKAVKEIEEVGHQTGGTLKQSKVAQNPDCITCMCPVDRSSEFYRLEGCGHGYCYDCLRMMLNSALSESSFPMLCAQAECQAPLVWNDLKNFIAKKWIQEHHLMTKSLDHFVSTNSRKYKYCITPNCSSVYKVTSSKRGREWICPVCAVRLCSSCNKIYHVGQPCVDEDELHTQRWLAEDRQNRKLCPGCKIPIEKNGGCNRVVCRICYVRFCWKCEAKFENSQQCYAHIVKVHGDFFD